MPRRPVAEECSVRPTWRAPDRHSRRSPRARPGRSCASCGCATSMDAAAVGAAASTRKGERTPLPR